MADYLACPYRTLILDGKQGTDAEQARCEIATQACLHQGQGYHIGICIACSAGPNPQTIESPVIRDLLARTYRRAFLIDTEKTAGTTSPSIRTIFLEKLRIMGEPPEELVTLLFQATAKGIIKDESEAITLFDKATTSESK